MSTLPPLIKMPTRLPRSCSFIGRAAAKAMRSTSWASLTVSTLSTSRRMMGNNWRDRPTVLPGGAVRPNTAPAIARDMALAAHNFSPDHRRVRAPALVITVDPGTLRNLLPWLSPQSDPAVLAAGTAFFDAFRPLRLADGERLAAALPGCTHLLIRNGFHGDFFIEHETAVVNAIEAVRWEDPP